MYSLHSSLNHTCFDLRRDLRVTDEETPPMLFLISFGHGDPYNAATLFILLCQPDRDKHGDTIISSISISTLNDDTVLLPLTNLPSGVIRYHRIIQVSLYEEISSPTKQKHVSSRSNSAALWKGTNIKREVERYAWLLTFRTHPP